MDRRNTQTHIWTERLFYGYVTLIDTRFNVALILVKANQVTFSSLQLVKVTLGIEKPFQNLAVS